MVHIFRFHNGQTVEFLDVGQPLSENSPNEKPPQEIFMKNGSIAETT